MIRQEKIGAALRALNVVLVLARKMAYDEAPAADIAEVLDGAECLPLLMAATEDQTEFFRKQLLHLAALSPALAAAVEEFDRSA